MNTTITWSALIEGSDALCVTRHTTTIYGIVTPPGDNAAAIAIRWWLEDADPDQPSLTNWDSIIGDDEVCATAHVMIHEPAELTGLYEIHLERQITATGYVAEPDEHPDVVALLSAQTAAEEAV